MSSVQCTSFAHFEPKIDTHFRRRRWHCNRTFFIRLRYTFFSHFKLKIDRRFHHQIFYHKRTFISRLLFVSVDHFKASVDTHCCHRILHNIAILKTRSANNLFINDSQVAMKVSFLFDDQITSDIRKIANMMFVYFRKTTKYIRRFVIVSHHISKILSWLKFHSLIWCTWNEKSCGNGRLSDITWAMNGYHASWNFYKH